MNLFARLLWLRMVGRLRPRSGLLGPVRTPFRVWPTDLDVLRHVNNGVYLSLLDIARTDLLIRARLAGALKERGWFPVVTAESIGFRRSLTLFQRFDVETRVLGWDDVSFYIHQGFIRDGDVIASALVAGRFLSRDGGSVPTADVAALGGVTKSPEVPGWARRLAADQERLRKNVVGPPEPGRRKTS
ncbi:MAG: acyl-CoA thioesterase [Longimicrobiales bacterium]|nr:acyl-CoA thioesterase [Longimicrobiales bacterium]